MNKEIQFSEKAHRIRSKGIRFLLIVLLIALVSGTVTSCQKTQDATQPTDTTKETNQTESQPANPTESGTAKQTDNQATETGTSQTVLNTVEKGKLIVGMELAYPPFEGKDTNGNPQGISPDFVNALAEHLKLELVIENIAWDGLIPALETGKIDLVMSSMTITEKREEVIDFSEPYANAYLALLTSTPSEIKSIDDLNQDGRKIAVKTGSTGFFYAQKNLTKAEVVSFPDESACVTEVSQGKADAFIYDQLTIYRNWKMHENTCTPVFIPFQEAEKWGLAFKEGNDALRVAVNGFIAQFRADGGFERLSELYLADEKQVFDELGFKWFFDLEP